LGNRNGSGTEEVPLSKVCQQVPSAAGLRQILAVLCKMKPYSHSDWLNAMLDDQEVEIRRSIFRLVCDGDHTIAARAKILKLAAEMSPLAWERFFPPPDEHVWANRLRVWLRVPDTDSVTHWFVEGVSLLRQSTLTP